MLSLRLLRGRHRVGRGALLSLLVLLGFGGRVRAGVLGKQHGSAGEERKAQGGDHEFFHFLEFSLLNLNSTSVLSKDMVATLGEGVLKDTLKLANVDSF